MSTRSVVGDGLFFSREIGWIRAADPYGPLGLAPDTPQDEIAAHLGATAPESSRFILGNPARRLAYHLVEPPTITPSSSDYATALWRADKAWLCAAHLLKEALRSEHDEGDPHWRDRWEAADEAWARFAGSRAGARHLSAAARRLGCTAPEEVATEVLGAITTELLPGLHALFAATGQDDARCGYHAQRAYDTEGESLPVWCARRHGFEQGLAEARRLKGAGRHLPALRAYAALRTTDGRERGVIAAETGEMALELLPENVLPTLGRALELIRALDGVIAAAPLDPRPFAVLVPLHLRCGVWLVNDQERFEDGVHHLVLARALDPSSEAAERLLRQAVTMIQGVADEMAAALAGGRQLNTAGYMLRGEVQRALGAARTLPHSPEVTRLAEQQERALPAALALRLGLDPTSDADRTTAVEVAAELIDADARPLGALREEMVTAHPSLSGAPWDDLAALRGDRASLSLRDLLDGLPVPEVLPPSAGAEILARMRAQMPETKPRRPRGLAAAWLFSGAQPRAKVLGAVGAASLAAALGLYVTAAYDAQVRDAAFESLRAARAEDRPAAVIDAGRSFLEHTAARSGDPRLPEVRLALSDALWREILRAQREGDEGALARLLSSARAALAHEGGSEK